MQAIGSALLFRLNHSTLPIHVLLVWNLMECKEAQSVGQLINGLSTGNQELI